MGSSSSKREGLYAYDSVALGDIGGGWIPSLRKNRKLFSMPTSRNDELQNEELQYAGKQLWDLNIFGKERLLELVQHT